MSICGHDVETLDRLHVHSDVSCPTITSVSIGKHVCRKSLIHIVRWIDVTVVSTAELWPAGIVLDVKVLDHHSVHSLVVDELSGDCEWEAYRELVINCDRSLPDLWHLERRINISAL